MKTKLPQSAAILLLLGSTVIMTAGCIDRVAMQMRYDSQRDDCRREAESALDRDVDDDDISGNNIKSREDGKKSRELAGHFSDCMEKGGWTIATPSHNPNPSPNPPGPVPMPVGTPVPGPRPGVDYTERDGSQYPGQVNPGPATAAMRRPDGAAGAVGARGATGAAGAAAPTYAQPKPMPPAAYSVPAESKAPSAAIPSPAASIDTTPQSAFDSEFQRMR